MVCFGAGHQKAFETLKRALCETPVLQIPNFHKEFVLVTAVSTVFNHRVNGELAPILFYSRLLSSTERRYSTYEEHLAILFGYERCRSYLKHKEFELHYDNLALCWLLRRVKDVGDGYYV
jgi:hypothetical protein